MKFVWLFILPVILLACSKKGPDYTTQQNSKSRLPRKAWYYQIDSIHPSEVLVFNYDGLPNTVVVSGGVGTYLQQGALYYYNTDSFLTGYQCYNRVFFEQIARSIVIKRDQSNKVLSMITTGHGPGYQSDTADFNYKYNGIYCLITILTHGYLCRAFFNC